ncbi:MAG: DUF3006 domain-containing protein [Bacillota bacterium]
MFYVIDRFEGQWAIIDYCGVIFQVPRGLFPKNAKEGDIIRITIQVDKERTDKSRNELNDLMDLFED